ncbi:MAG TPA: outer membrane beta-barrel protein [Terracidiphilus sp.]|nr:outer membrane beta-barrel protein [Terracidiphilus sp.]
MQINWKQAAFLLIATLAFAGSSALAQTDVSVSGFAAFNSSSTGNGTMQTSPNSEGGMIGVRHVFRPLVGAELNFAGEGSDQSLSPEANACGYRCGNPPVTLNGTAFQFTANYVVTAKYGNLHPFGEAGLGFLFTNPSGSGSVGGVPSKSNIVGTNSLSRPTWVLGGGADWYLTDRWGVRLQYRVDFYKAPDVYHGYSPTGVYVHTQEPMAGVVYRF